MDRIIAVTAVDDIVHKCDVLFIFHLRMRGVERLPEGLVQELFGYVAVLIHRIIILLGISLDDPVESLLFFQSIELKHQVIFEGICKITAFADFTNGVSGRGFTRIAPVLHIFIDGYFRLDLYIRIDPLAFQESNQLREMLHFGMAVKKRIFIEKTGIGVYIFEAVPGGGTAKNYISSENAQFIIIIKQREGIHLRIEPGYYVIVLREPDIAAGLSAKFSALVQQRRRFLCRYRAGKIKAGIEAQVQRTGHIRHILFIHCHTFFTEATCRLIRIILLDIREGQLFHSAKADRCLYSVSHGEDIGFDHFTSHGDQRLIEFIHCHVTAFSKFNIEVFTKIFRRLCPCRHVRGSFYSRTALCCSFRDCGFRCRGFGCR